VLVDEGALHDASSTEAEKRISATNLLLRVSANQPAAYNSDYAESAGQWLELKDDVDARILSRQAAGGFTGAFVGFYASGNGTNLANVAGFA
jgi:beta-xylosidase